MDSQHLGRHLARILFITSNRLGDAVLSTGVLARVLERHREALVTVVCGPVPAGLFAGVPGLEDVIVLQKRKYSLHWWKMWRRCALKVWDEVVDLRNAPLSYAVLARHQTHLGRAGKQDIHRVRALGSVLKGDDTPSPHLWTLPAHEAHGARLIPGAAPVLALGPTANWGGKIWPPERFVELALRLSAPDGILPGARIAVIAHTSEAALARPVLDALPKNRTIDLVGDVPLLALFAALKRVQFFIGNDSGLMHLAAASGVPTLGLFGPSREKHYAPWGEKCAFVRGEKSYDDVFPEDYDWQAKQCLMLDLNVDQAQRAARELWKAVS